MLKHTSFSHYLGRNEPLNAKTAAHTAVVMGATITCCVAVLVVLMGDLWLAMFTSDPEVIAVASEVVSHCPSASDSTFLTYLA